MTEWQDSQSSSRAGLQQRIRALIDAAKPERRQLSADEQTRLNKLENMLEQMRRGENVQNRQLQRWLLPEEFEELELAWQEQQELRLEMTDKPSDLVKYEKKLAKAIFFYNRAESYSAKGKIATAKKLYLSLIHI